jgi:hypothetical protein
MPFRPAPCVALALCLALPHAVFAAAAPRDVAAVILPSRDPDAALLAARVHSLGVALARAHHAAFVDGPGTDTSTGDVAVTLARALELADAADLDEAARVLDPALAAGTRAPQRFAGSDAFVTAALARVAIALARGETSVATVWLERLLRWAPALALTPAEDAPRLRAALAEARTRLGPRPELRREDLGGLCAVDELLVARTLAPGRIEVLRLRACRVVATAVVAEVDDSVLPLLDVTPAETAAPPRPLWRRGWFWVGVGVAASVVAVTLWQASEPGEQVDVVTHF